MNAKMQRSHKCKKKVAKNTKKAKIAKNTARMPTMPKKLSLRRILKM